MRTLRVVTEPAGPRSLRAFGVWALASCLLAALAFAVGSGTRSPWSEAQSNAETSLVVAQQLSTGSIEESRTFEGDLSLGSTTSIVLPEWSADLRPTVTSHPESIDSEVTSGTAILEVSGRPLLVLELPFGLYRDILPGDEGTDVEALQGALSAIGAYTGTIDGTYGAQTAAAVERLYRSAGYSPPEPSQEAQDTLQQARAALADADANADAADRDGLERALLEAEVAALTPVHAAEIVAIAGSAQLVAVASVGTVLGPEVEAAQLQTGGPTVRLRVNAADVALFTVDGAVTLSSTGASGGETVIGTIVTVGDFEQTNGAQTAADGQEPPIPGHDVVISAPDAASWNPEAPVIVRTEGGAGSTEGVLVPLTAVREDEEGTYVLVLTSPPPGSDDDVVTLTDPETERRDVVPGPTDGTYAVLTEPATVAEGDYVVVGAST